MTASGSTDLNWSRGDAATEVSSRINMAPRSADHHGPYQSPFWRRVRRLPFSPDSLEVSLAVVIAMGVGLAVMVHMVVAAATKVSPIS